LYAASEYQSDTKNDRPLYTDLLIHDMGAGLADGVKEFLAGPQDWRTTPLSGIQKHLSSGGTLLHDGRAQSIQEAILWHDGEAKNVRANYLSLNEDQKLLLEYFIEQL
ncbi:MAG: di-heme oxidoredictase family protein, partial [Burkholderiales bacterium]|nr:di-heme oxidoredictase family protein [Burkholderiales bacterium]